MNKYDSYKDSGVKWLGEIPSHWEVKRLRAAFSERKERYSSTESLMILSLIKDKGIIPYDEKGEVGNKSKDDHTQYKVARKGDLVINSMNVIIGSLGITPYDGYISPAYYSFIPHKEINIAYYNYILSLRKVQQSIRCFSKGIMEIRLKISAYDFLSMPFPFPSFQEQEAIANYLDSATSKIDEAIAQQQKMIDLLNERKQIIINNAVTKGLDPNVKMKPSGIDWIGDIPEGWEVKRIKNVINLLTDYDANGSFSDIANNCKINSGTPYAWMVRTTDLVNKRVGLVEGNNYCDLKTYNYLSKSSLCSGDLLMTKRGNVGMVYVVPECEVPMTLAPNLYLLKTKNNIVYNRYLMYYLSSSKAQGQLALLNKSTTLGALYKDDVKALQIVLPFKKMQVEIANYIDNKSVDIDLSINSINKKISLLQERKQIIINDVVTGKVKVV